MKRLKIKSKDSTAYSDMVEETMNFAVKKFTEDGFFEQHMFFVQCATKKDGLLAIPLPESLFSNQKGKEMVGFLLKRAVQYLEQQELEPELVLYISEVWLAKLNNKDDKLIKQAEKDGVRSLEDKQEGLMFIIETKEGIRQLYYDLIRDGEDFCVSEEPVEDFYQTKKDSYSYRFQVWDN